MNNRYLFRAKRTDNGEWVYGSVIYIDDCAYIICDAEIEDYDTVSADLYATEWYRVDPSTICQCTGLNDKNGKLIWENDIVRDDNGNIYKAFWRDRYYQFSWICVKSDKLPIGAKWNFWSIGNYEIEVIGSAIDNPEPLE